MVQNEEKLLSVFCIITSIMPADRYSISFYSDLEIDGLPGLGPGQNFGWY